MAAIFKNVDFSRELRAGFMRFFRRKHSNVNRNFETCRILGIETSCDETGAAVVNGNGQILGEDLFSQLKTHLTYLLQFKCIFKGILGELSFNIVRFVPR